MGNAYTGYPKINHFYKMAGGKSSSAKLLKWIWTPHFTICPASVFISQPKHKTRTMLLSVDIAIAQQKAFPRETISRERILFLIKVALPTLIKHPNKAYLLKFKYPITTKLQFKLAFTSYHNLWHHILCYWVGTKSVSQKLKCILSLNQVYNVN